MAALFVVSLAGCAGWPARNDAPDSGELLRNSLPVAAAALAAGQTDVARRLYLALAERYDDAPEPFLGLGYIAFRNGDLPAADRYFLQAAERATEAPAKRAEALLAAGRTQLAQGGTHMAREARRHFLAAREPGRDTPLAAWIENGLAVTAALDSDYHAAAAHYAEALRLSGEDPRIAANHVRMLVAAGRIDEAARAWRAHPASYWGDNGPVLSRLVEEARRERRRRMLAGAPDGTGAGAGTAVAAGVAAGVATGAGVVVAKVAAEAGIATGAAVGAGVITGAAVGSGAGGGAEADVAAGFEFGAKAGIGAAVGAVVGAGAAVGTGVVVGAAVGAGTGADAGAVSSRGGPDASPFGHSTTASVRPGLRPAGDAEPSRPRETSQPGDIPQPRETSQSRETSRPAESTDLAESTGPTEPAQPPRHPALPDLAWPPEPVDLTRPPPLFDASLALRLSPPGPPRPEAEAQARPFGVAVSRISPGLMLELHRGSGPRTPSPTANGAARQPAPTGPSGARDPLAVAGAAPPEPSPLPAAEPAAAVSGRPDPGIATAPGAAPVAVARSGSRGRASGLPGSEPAQASAPAALPAASEAIPARPLPESGVPRVAASESAGAHAPAALPAAPEALPARPLPESGVPRVAVSEPAGAHAPAPAGTALAHPLPDPGAPRVAASEPSAPATLTLPLGHSRRLHLEHAATTVLVASPEVADVRLLAPDVLYVLGKTVGRTSVAVLDEDDRIEERVVSVVLDLEPLHTVLAGEPDLRGVRARRLLRGVALTGEVASVASVDRARRLAAGALPEGVPIENELQVAAPQQVALEVQIAEVNRSVTENLGVNWEAFRVRGDQGFGFRIGRAIGGPGFDPSDSAFFPGTTFEGEPSAGIYGGRRTGRTRIGFMIDALSTAGLANVLARPTLTAVSGETASFFSGGERPTPTGYDSETNTIIFEYKKVGVLLDFVPTVIDAGRIVLTVRPEVSEPDGSSEALRIGEVSVPVINVRRAETTVEVGDGESIVIAGLFRNRSSTNESGLPVLKDAPILGVLFGTTSTLSEEHELIVIVTARLVQARTAPGDPGATPATRQTNGYHY